MNDYDCIVVGARCGGAALATHLARAGMRVVVLEADALHTDQPFSTHAIQASGMDELDELGVGARIRELTPEVRCARFMVREHYLDLTAPEQRPMFCPRRSTLDPLLQDTARDAGAELHSHTRVTELVRDGERVCGVRAKRRKHVEEYRARWVIGADGRNSTVAKLVGARNYIEHTSERGGYWAYYPKPACWDRDEPWRSFQTVINLDAVARFAFECDGDLVVAGVFPADVVARSWGREYAREMRNALLALPLTAAVAAADPIAPPIGLLKGHYYVREAVGPGWALVGDAGVHKDATPGFGITDALIDARALAHALVDGRPEALELFWRERDVATIPLYFQALLMGRLGYVNPFSELFLDSVNRDPELVRNMVEVLDRKRSPYAAVPNGRMLAWVARALLRGRPDVALAFPGMVRSSIEMQRALRPRLKLLARARARLARAPATRPFQLHAQMRNETPATSDG